MIVCLTSCGSKNKDGIYDVTVDNTVIGGKLSQYFTLVDKTYKYKVDYGLIDEISVELKCIAPLPENLKAYIGIEVLDEDGVTISVDAPDENSCDATDVLRQATPGQTVSINIKNFESVEKQIPAKIRLSSLVEEEKLKKLILKKPQTKHPPSILATSLYLQKLKMMLKLLELAKP